MIDAVARLDVKSTTFHARAGIATGLVVVGDLIGEGSAQEQPVVGETPNLAARLQGLTEPDMVVIAAGTRRLVGDLFEYRDLGAVEVKGIAAPVPAWQVLRPSAVESRFEALRGSALRRRSQHIFEPTCTDMRVTDTRGFGGAGEGSNLNTSDELSVVSRPRNHPD